jgi:hypothetical protein
VLHILESSFQCRSCWDPLREWGSFPADVAVGALRILLRGAAALPWETIQAVLLRAARLDMNTELNAFAAGLASRRVEAPPDLASLTASLVDSPPLAKAVLDSAGMPMTLFPVFFVLFFSFFSHFNHELYKLKEIY